MELFIPGLIVFVLAAFFIFLIMPRMGTPILVGASMIALVLAGWHHYALFSVEYKQSTWQHGLTAYAPWIVLFGGLIFIIGALQWVLGKGGAKTEETPAEVISKSLNTSINSMPPANTASNPITAALNTGIRNLKNSPLIPGLGFSSSQV